MDSLNKLKTFEAFCEHFENLLQVTAEISAKNQPEQSSEWAQFLPVLRAASNSRSSLDDDLASLSALMESIVSSQKCSTMDVLAMSFRLVRVFAGAVRSGLCPNGGRSFLELLSKQLAAHRSISELPLLVEFDELLQIVVDNEPHGRTSIVEYEDQLNNYRNVFVCSLCNCLVGDPVEHGLKLSHLMRFIANVFLENLDSLQNGLGPAERMKCLREKVLLEKRLFVGHEKRPISQLPKEYLNQLEPYEKRSPISSNCRTRSRSRSPLRRTYNIFSTLSLSKDNNSGTLLTNENRPTPEAPSNSRPSSWMLAMPSEGTPLTTPSSLSNYSQTNDFGLRRYYENETATNSRSLSDADQWVTNLFIGAPAMTSAAPTPAGRPALLRTPVGRLPSSNWRRPVVD